MYKQVLEKKCGLENKRVIRDRMELKESGQGEKNGDKKGKRGRTGWS